MLISGKFDYFVVFLSIGTKSFLRMVLSIILSAVERYVRNAAEDVRDLATHVNDNGKRLLDLDEHSREQSKKATTWHKETKTAMDVISEHVLAHDSATKEQHQNIEDGLNQIRYDVKNHSHECKIEEEKKKKGKKTMDII